MVYFRLVLTIISSLAFIVIVYGIASIYDEFTLIAPQPPTRLDQWLPTYIRYAGWYGIGITTIGNILWYISAQRFLRVNDYKKAGRRVWWIVFLLFPMIGILVSLQVLIVKPIQDGSEWVFLFSLFVPIACYYLITVFLSPLSFKYTPWGAGKLRHW